MADDEIDIHLRDPAHIAARAIVVATVLRRLALEQLDKGDENEATAEAFDLREWLREQRLTDEMTSHEQSLMSRPRGGLADTERLEETWQGEGLLVLVWALGRGELPPPGAPATVGSVLAAIPAAWDETNAWIAGAALRPESVIATERERAELWHWRADIESAWREASPQDRRDYDLAIRDVSAEAAAAGLLSDRAADDFAVGGHSVRSLSPDELDDLIAFSTERLRALNWLCGFGASWDDVPLDV